MKKEVEKLEEVLQESYGDKVEVKYIDLEKEGLDKYPLVSQVVERGYPYPITVINGEPRFAGAIMVPEIKKSIEQLLNN
ncbi:MAG: DUF1462 family protein [Syntrophomonadaceae bacterium]|nr:DUF1462 family protein [Syntrophomonadaceae bacterium]